jgi:peptidoglycan/xylan/chitin deacetylase (PgdA/CDA1 family)
MTTIDAIANARRFDARRDEGVKDLRWPGGAGLALSFVLNIEEGAELSIADGDDVNESVHEITHCLDGIPDFCMASHFEYGARAGYARVVRRFADAGLPLTLNVCGRALERTPWVADDAHRHGFEMCGHGWRWESPAGMDEPGERESIARTAAIITRLGGHVPAGWHCKGSRSPHTRRLLRAHGGFVYDSDDYGDDLPHLVDFGDGRPAHVVLPYGFDTNDMRFFDRGGFVHAHDFSIYVGDAITALLAEARQAPRMLTIGLHARVIGRPGRIAGLDAVLQQVAGLGDAVCVMTREALARHWLAQAPAAAAAAALDEFKDPSK